jgi:hypothetical protein
MLLAGQLAMSTEVQIFVSTMWQIRLQLDSHLAAFSLLLLPLVPFLPVVERKFLLLF